MQRAIEGALCWRQRGAADERVASFPKEPIMDISRGALSRHAASATALAFAAQTKKKQHCTLIVPRVWHNDSKRVFKE
jgi:hypothetical protein